MEFLNRKYGTKRYSLLDTSGYIGSFQNDTVHIGEKSWKLKNPVDKATSIHFKGKTNHFYQRSPTFIFYKHSYELTIIFPHCCSEDTVKCFIDRY